MSLIIHLVRGEMRFILETYCSETNRLVIGLSIPIVIAAKGPIVKKVVRWGHLLKGYRRGFRFQACS